MWDQKYNTPEYIYGVEPNGFLEANVATLPKGKILCLAEGEGRNSVFLAKNGYHVTAVDSSSVGLQKAERLAQKNNVAIRFVCADLAEFNLGYEQWDGIVSVFCHLSEKLRGDLYQRVCQGLRPSGVFLAEGYIPRQLQYKTGGPKVEEQMISADILARELPCLEFTHLEEMDREIIEGTHHFGMGAVVQAVGIKTHRLKM